MKFNQQTLSKSKRLGQHFLTDQGLLEKITNTMHIQPDHHIIEIGAGDGVLTQRLVQTGARITAVEFDKRLIPLLTRKFDKVRTLRILEGNALTIPLATLLRWEPDGAAPNDLEATDTNTPTRIVGNLPYNISSQIILRFVPVARLLDMHFLIQRELAQRLTATIGNYGRFTLAVRLWRRSQSLFDLPPQAFDPPPAVFSTLVQFGAYQPLSESEEQRSAFHRLIDVAFQQRRKQLGNCLSQLVAKDTFEQLGIAPTKRPESLAIEDWLRLAAQIN